MKKCLYSVVILILFITSKTVQAQQTEQIVRLANGNLITGNNIQKKIFNKQSIELSKYGDNYFVIIQFVTLPTKQLQDSLQKAGIKFDGYLPGNAYLASIKKDFDFETAKQFGIISINLLPVSMKLSKQILNYKPSADKNEPLIAVSFFKSIGKNIVEKAVQQAGAMVIKTKYSTSNTIYVSANKAAINIIAGLPFITNISLQVLKDKSLNYNGRATEGVSGLNAINGKNLNGKGVTVGIGDNGDMSSHIDISGRLIVRTPVYPAHHATHVAGTVGGAGIINVKNRGMASKATMINQYYSDIISNAPTYVTDNNMVVTNNSYYSALDYCNGEGQYDALSNYADDQLYQYKQLLHVVAAGNDGGLTCSSYPASFGTIKSGWQCAKNVLTVGAADVKDYSIAYFSSRGPVADGRIKPEITASGVNVMSTFAYNNYSNDNGTSMASPSITGALALLNERYRQLHAGLNPISALLKAVVCNTAEDLGNSGPDYTFGFGLLNARRAAEAMEANRYSVNNMINGGNASQIISVPANTKRLKVLLYWADAASSANAATSLVNDLDITVSDPSSVTHLPMILNPDPLHVKDIAAEGADHLNNIEQVVIENPAAGNYNINVSGFAVPFGPQQYVVSYEIIAPSVTVEYPFGGETWVPGETENIRWSGIGDDANTFSIDSSLDNGVSWGTINNNIPATSKTYAWKVPPAFTNNARIRVRRNSSSLSGESNFSFTILGQPVIAATNVCSGAVQLDWPAITGATSYDILQLNGDSMQVIANTATNTFLLLGLNKNNITWLGVAAKNGAVSGRRSISVSTMPNSGSCALPTFNNDLLVDSILTPNTARQHFANETNATASVSILIKNLGTTIVNGPFDVSYSYGGAAVTETINTSIAAGASISYSFTGSYPIVSSGFTYNFKAWVTLGADGNHVNDTAYKLVQSINNDPISSMPFTENFESMADVNITRSGMAIANNKYLDFNTSTSRGRARTVVNTGFAYAGTRSLTLDQWPRNSVTTVDSVTLNYNLNNYTADQLRFDFYYNNHGVENYAGNKIWIRGSEFGAWIQAYDLYLNQAATGQWKHGLFDINDVLSSASPAQAITQTFQIKICEEGLTSANSVSIDGAMDNGYTFDNLSLYQVFNDIELVKINAPDKAGCALTATNSVSINIKNNAGTNLSNINVSYQLNNGTVVTEIVPSIPANQSLNYTFAQKADLSAYIDYSLNAWCKYPGDTYPVNDSILNYTFHNSPVINTYPYVESFENSNGNFYTNGMADSWQWGTPAKTIINKSASGIKAWVTNLTGNYNNSETSYLYTPCFDISTLFKPTLSFSHIFNVELDFDYTWVEYSTDGVTWQKLGAASGGTNWYDNVTLKNWRLSNNKWHVANFDIPVTASNIRFRFVLSSDAGVTMEGVGIDDVSVHEKSVIAINPPVSNIVVANVSGNNWVPFTSGAAGTDPFYMLAEINPNGQNLGSVSINLYPNNTGAVRASNNQYYLDRNIVIHPSNPPAGNVGVRLYFTDVEVNALLSANSCSSCSKPADAFRFGVTKYSGSMAEENGMIEDDISGFFHFILPANTIIIPHGNGYYAEFTVNSFSEFWLNTGGVNGMNPLPVNLISFDATKQSGKALLTWKTDQEINTAKYIIERSSDTRNFVSIGTVAALSSFTMQQYNFTDAQPLPGINFYRLKIIERDGKFTTSPIRKLDFSNNDDDFLIYPNPVSNGVVFISGTANCNAAILYDASGKMVKSFVLQGRNNTLNISAIAKGIYLLKIFAENEIHTEKLFIQ